MSGLASHSESDERIKYLRDRGVEVDLAEERTSKNAAPIVEEGGSTFTYLFIPINAHEVKINPQMHRISSFILFISFMFLQYSLLSS